MNVRAPLPHDSARLHVTGGARYVSDIPAPRDALHLCFGLATVAAGRITSMDLADVRAAPGVVRVLTAADLKRPADTSPGAHDEPLLTDGHVRYLGHPMFLVAADSHLEARRAARLAVIEYEEEPALLTIDDAIAADSRFEDGPIIWQLGDAAAAIKGAAHRIEGTVEIGGQEHFYLEGQAALALPQEGGDMAIHSSTQHPSEIQHKVADALGVPMHSVRVETRRMGGGFGGKESQGNVLAVACAVAAEATGRPCRMRYDRDDDITITGKRHDFRIHYRAGYDDEGRVSGVDFVQYARCGWSQDLSLAVADRAMLHAGNAYNLPDIRIENHRLKTNTTSATAFRGFGGPQGMIGIERVMDEIAHKLGRDPLEVRRANYFAAAEPDGAKPALTPHHRSRQEALSGTAPQPGDDLTSRGAHVSADDAAVTVPAPKDAQLTPYHMPVTDFILHEMTEDLVRRCDYDARRKAIAAWNAHQPILKKGLAITPVMFGISFTATHLNQAGALVHVYQDGSVHLNHGGTEMGQGLHRKVMQVAAEAFGIEDGSVRITATDTGKVPNTSATAASSGSDLNGMAVKAACDTIRTRMAEHLAEAHGVVPADVVFADGEVRAGNTVLTFAEAAAETYEARVSLSSTGFYRTPDLAWDRVGGTGKPFHYFAYGVAATEVVIDTLTGENRILRTDIVHDCGSSINPGVDMGQIEGGYVQGAGWLTTEELVWDDKGRLRTHAPSTYKIPACSDRPEEFNVTFWDAPNRAETVYSSKAVGEPPLMLAISVLSALNDAVSACGDGFAALDTPATPERVLNAVMRVRDGV